MDLGEALDVNPAWLEFGEPYASRPWPDEVPRKPREPEKPDFAKMLRLADQLFRQTKKHQVSETASLLALNLAYYQIQFGEIPPANFEKLMATGEMNNETARLVAVGMENLVGVLGLVSTQAESASETLK